MKQQNGIPRWLLPVMCLLVLAAIITLAFMREGGLIVLAVLLLAMLFPDFRERLLPPIVIGLGKWFQARCGRDPQDRELK